MKKVLDELSAIEALEQELLGLYPPGSVLKPPEDAHDIPIRGERILLSVDGNSEEYSRYPWENRFDWAWRSLVGPLADLVAKGARPLAFAVDLGVPKGISMDALREVGKGLAEAARFHKVFFLGGDLNRSPGTSMWISVTGIGVAKAIPITRGGGRVGEGVFTTLVNGYGVTGLMRLAFYGNSGPRNRLTSAVKRLRWRPVAPLSFPDLAGLVNISSSIDTSDGLLRSLLLLSRSSGLSICLERLPPLSGVPSWVLDIARSELGEGWVETAVLEGGEEYEIVFSTGVGEETVYSNCSNKGLRCMKIGEYCGPGGGRVIYGDRTLREGGWDNLQSTL